MRLRYTLEAAAELDQVLTTIEDKSPSGARNVRLRIQAVANLLLQHPRAGQLTRGRRLRRMRAAPYPYLVFYQVIDDEIIIHGVRHSARRPSSMPD